MGSIGGKVQMDDRSSGLLVIVVLLSGFAAGWYLKPWNPPKAISAPLHPVVVEPPASAEIPKAEAAAGPSVGQAEEMPQVLCELGINLYRAYRESLYDENRCHFFQNTGQLGGASQRIQLKTLQDLARAKSQEMADIAHEIDYSSAYKSQTASIVQTILELHEKRCAVWQIWMNMFDYALDNNQRGGPAREDAKRRIEEYQVEVGKAGKELSLVEAKADHDINGFFGMCGYLSVKRGNPKPVVKY